MQLPKQKPSLPTSAVLLTQTLRNSASHCASAIRTGYGTLKKLAQADQTGATDGGSGGSIFPDPRARSTPVINCGHGRPSLQGAVERKPSSKRRCIVSLIFRGVFGKSVAILAVICQRCDKENPFFLTFHLCSAAFPAPPLRIVYGGRPSVPDSALPFPCRLSAALEIFSRSQDF